MVAAAQLTQHETTQRAPWMTEEHELFADMVAKFLAAEMAPNIEHWSQTGVVPDQFWRQAGELGILGASVPPEYGGSGGDYGYDLIVMQEQGRAGDAGWGFSVHSIATHYLVNLGSEEQKQRWLPRLCSGELIGAIVMTEPGAGSDLQGLRSSAVRDGEDYVVNGSKTFITNGQSANLLVVAVKTDPALGSRGVSLLVMETDGLDGFRRGRKLDKIGVKANDTSELFFENVRVPASNLLGQSEGQGFYQLMQELDFERLIIAMLALGCSECAFKETLRYVSERRAFGKTLLEFQNTRFTLAECQTQLEAMRAFVNSAVAALLAGSFSPARASMVKLFATESQSKIVDQCLQLFGGYGYMTEYPIARLYTDARIQRIWGGTSEIQKEIIAKSFRPE